MIFYKFRFVKLFFENRTDEISVSETEPLETALEQALEIFDNLPDEYESSFGLLNERDERLIFYKFNPFLWKLELSGSFDHKYFALCPVHRCRQFIIGLFSGASAFSLVDFKRE